MNTKNLLLLCIASTSIFAMKNEENSLTQHSKNYDNKDLFYTPYITTVHQKNPITQNERSLFKQLINQFKNPDYNESINFLNNKHDELSALAHKYKIQNLYLTLFTRAVPINELQNIIIKNYHSLITYTNNQEKALNHLKQSLLNSKIPKTVQTILPAIPLIHKYSHDKKYGLNKPKQEHISLYDIQKNERIIPEETILTACFLYKKNILAYINKYSQLIRYDIKKNKKTNIAQCIPHERIYGSYYWKIKAHTDNFLFIIPTRCADNFAYELILVSLLDGTTQTIIPDPFYAITFNKNCSFIITSSCCTRKINYPPKLTLYTFNKNILNDLTHQNTKSVYKKLKFNNSHTSFIAKTKHDSNNEAAVFNIIKENNSYHMKQIINKHSIQLFYSPKHNDPYISIERTQRNTDSKKIYSSINTFDRNGIKTSSTQHPKAYKPAFSKNTQFLALTSTKNTDMIRQAQQTLIVQNLFDYHKTEKEISDNTIGNIIRRLYFHPNSTLIIGDSWGEATIYTINGEILATIPITRFCKSHLNESGTVISDTQNSYELYSSKDLETLDTIIQNHSINLLQYFALKNIDDKKRDSNGTYSVPQTLFNKLCWESFKEDEIKSLSETLNLKIEG